MLHMFANGYYLIRGSHIELHFNVKPEYKIIETLHICNWHWYEKGKYWSNFYNKENLEFAQSIFEKADISNPKHTPTKKLPQKEIRIEDIVIRNTSFYCAKNHKMQDIVGIVEVMDKIGNTKKYSIPMYYCANCGRYYILEETAKQYRKKGVLLCRIISVNTYKENAPHIKELRDESILKQYGYSVSQEDSLSEEQRQRVLMKLIDKKIVTKTEVLSYLDFFCKLRGDAKSDNAVYCWKKDRNAISDYNNINTETVKIIN